MPLARPPHVNRLAWRVFCACAVWLAIGTGPSSAQELPSIALLPVVVHSAESPEYLRRGLADMLSSRFEQAAVFRVIRVDDPGKSTTRLAQALEVGRGVGADFVLFGSFTRFGTGASLDMQAAATASSHGGETLREIFVHSGSIGEVIPDLEDLVGKVTRFANADYEPSDADSTASPGPPSARGEIHELRRRVEELERLFGELQGASGESR